MRLKNIYNALYKGIKSLNDLNKALFVLRMDGDIMLLNDCSHNHVVISCRCDEIEKFIVQLTILRDAIFYVTNVSPQYVNQQKYQHYINLLNTKFYGKK